MRRIRLLTEAKHAVHADACGASSINMSHRVNGRRI